MCKVTRAGRYCVLYSNVCNLAHMSMTVPNDQVVIPSLSRAQRMRAARETTGLTQEEFASEIGLNRRTVARWEREEGPAPRSVLLLVQMRTKVPEQWLLTGKYTPRDLNPEPTD